jgi:phosphoribosylaminoimidazole-succinocarboxamide synthase
MQEILGYNHVHSGKVRELYQSNTNQNELLVVATDRISAFDYILKPEVPNKGRILTQMSLLWFDKLSAVVPNHLLQQQNIPQPVQGRAMLCKKLKMLPFECVARGFLTGSAYKQYKQTGSFLDHALPSGMKDGDQLPEPIFTPATKAELAEHDENVTFQRVIDDLGIETATKLKELTLEIYRFASDLSQKAGYILVDTKLEFGLDEKNTITLGDEVLTPDSSRYINLEKKSIDKQFVRDYLLNLPDWTPESNIEPPVLPDEIVEQTSLRYNAIYEDFKNLF